MRQFRNQSYRSAQAMTASFDACLVLAVKGEAHPLLPSFVKQRNGHGWTLLTVLADRYSPAGVKVALAAGADPLATNKNGQTALQFVEANPPILPEPRYSDLMALRADVIALLMHAENLARNTVGSGRAFAEDAPCAPPVQPEQQLDQPARRPARAFA